MNATEDLKNYFCGKPFEWLELSLNRRFYLCCPNWLPNPIRATSALAAWNSETAREIRQSILDGSFSFCQNCPYLSEKTGPVKPLDMVDDEVMKDIIENKRTTLQRGPVWLNFSHDPSCNLTCPSCRVKPARSTPHALHRRKRIMDRTLMELKDHLQWLYLSGSGDPFGNPLYFELLRELKETDHPRLKLYLHSNGQLFDRQRWQDIAAINQRVKWVHISVDAASRETYLLNRKSNWETLLKNLDFISSLRQHGPVEIFEISMVVQQNNWQEMLQFIELARKLNVDRVLFTPLLNWGTFSDEEYKNRAVHLQSHAQHHLLKGYLKKEASNYRHYNEISVSWGPFAHYLEN